MAKKSVRESRREPTHVTLPIEAIPDLRWALAMGLHAIAEVERCRQEFEFRTNYCRPKGLPDELNPISAMEGADDMSRYAETLMWLDYAKEVDR